MRKNHIPLDAGQSSKVTWACNFWHHFYTWWLMQRFLKGSNGLALATTCHVTFHKNSMQVLVECDVAMMCNFSINLFPWNGQTFCSAYCWHIKAWRAISVLIQQHYCQTGIMQMQLPRKDWKGPCTSSCNNVSENSAQILQKGHYFSTCWSFVLTLALEMRTD